MSTAETMETGEGRGAHRCGACAALGAIWFWFAGWLCAAALQRLGPKQARYAAAVRRTFTRGKSPAEATRPTS